MVNIFLTTRCKITFPLKAVCDSTNPSYRYLVGNILLGIWFTPHFFYVQPLVFRPYLRCSPSLLARRRPRRGRIGHISPWAAGKRTFQGRPLTDGLTGDNLVRGLLIPLRSRNSYCPRSRSGTRTFSACFLWR